MAVFHIGRGGYFCQYIRGHFLYLYHDEPVDEHLLSLYLYLFDLFAKQHIDNNISDRHTDTCCNSRAFYSLPRKHYYDE